MSLRALSMIGRTALLGSLALGLSACGVLESVGLGSSEPDAPQPNQTFRQNSDGSAGMNVAARPAGTVAVNAFLWRAALDTVEFMPIIQADPYGGIILTDWYAPPATPTERFKVNLYIVDAALRADGVRASVFRQVQQNGVWVDAPVTTETRTQLEDSVLTRARQLRQQAVAAEAK
ncbi:MULTISPECIES: DUF3576 domain-containing protein [unclassified Azospirillum]|jgi:hypothetical protein|uniref:DUF3576 domain-containing protein n=1 Tax=unclassified Azospirillum TaxID=2630922 RepID=UPI000B70C8FC|nr:MULTISPECIES: DUF3576 domain-containing protein [unclassified Azospirillum]SNT18750.1 protein of unknown function [Azospirillum sp. RU38E]SNT30720.1 protein of unknown function [Azospirillum sp. RU37A]